MSGLVTKANLVRDVWRQHGAYEAARVAWGTLRHAHTTRLFLFVLSDPRPLPEAVAAAKHHHLDFATAAELERLLADNAARIAPVEVERVASGAARCLLQLDGERLVGYVWVWNGQLAPVEAGFHFNLPDDTRYNYKSYTMPDYRGHAFQALRHAEVLRRLWPEGVRQVFAFVSHTNSNSLRGLIKGGYRQVGELRVSRRFGRVHATVVTDRDSWSTAERS